MPHQEDVEKSAITNVEELSEFPSPPEENDYILKRHGTLKLNPMPTNDPKDPLNWSELKKFYHLFLVAYMCMCGTYFGSGIIGSYASLAMEYKTPLPDASYFTSVQIVILGTFPFFWFPIMSMYGRKPVMVFCALAATGFNIGCGFAPNYGTQMAMRALVSVFIAPSMALGNIVVTELFFNHQRGSRNGVWTMMMTMGPCLGPLIMAFVEQRAGTQWVFFVFAFMSFAGFLGWLFASETLYLRGEDHGKEKRYLFGLITRTTHTIRPIEFIEPLFQAKDYRVSVASAAYAFVCCYSSVLISVEMPQVMGQKFHLDAQGIGLQFIAIIIGTLIGELLAGPLSDFWMKWRSRKRGVRIIEDRLWISYNGFICVVFGLIIWGVRTQQAKEGVWNVTPLIGAAFASVGAQIVTTVLITFSIDTNPQASVPIGLFVNMVRQVWTFIGPFYFPPMFDTLGVGGACGLMAGLTAFSGLWVVIIHIFGIRRDGFSLL